MQSETGFPNSHQLKSYVASKSRLKLAARCPVNGCWPSCLGLLPPDGILPGAKFTLCPSFAFSCIVSVTAWHSSSGSQPNFSAWYTEWNYGNFADGATYVRLGGHHVGHRHTF